MSERAMGMSTAVACETRGGEVLRRQCACGTHTGGAAECSRCRAEKARVQRKLTIGASSDPLELEADRVADHVLSSSAGSGAAHAAVSVQRFADDSRTPVEAAPESVHQTLAMPGHPLDPALRRDMEQRFDHDFSAVRVHDGAVAEQSASDVNASAYAVGHDLVFAAGQFAPTTTDGRRLIAHELTHVVQQSGPGSGGLQHGDAMSAHPAISRARGDVLHAQPDRRRKTEAHWEPEVQAETRSVHMKVGEKASLKFRVVNGDSAPSGTAFDWRGVHINESDAVASLGFSDPRGTRGTLTVKGQSPGIADVGATLHFKTPGGQEDEESTPLVRVEVGSQFEAAQGELAQIEKLRGAGKEVSPSRESAAQQEAALAAQKEVSRGKGAGGGEINLILKNIGLDIAKIENARYRGYQDALTHLNLTQFDEKAQAGNVKSFVLQLIGNLAWALSGLIVITPIGLEATIAVGLLAKYGAQVGERMATKLVPLLVQTRAVYIGRLATAVDLGGAMLAQFAHGLPTGATKGGNVSAPVIQLQQKLNDLNAGVFNALSRSVYSILLQMIDYVPADKDVDAQGYAGRLETGMRRMLFPGYYQNGGATGNQVNPSVIQSDARDQLLRRLSVAAGKLSGDTIVSTKIDEDSLGKLVAPAVKLVGGAKALELGDYELVLEQLQRVAREFEIEGVPKMDPDQLRKIFAESDTLVLSARVTDGGVAITNAVKVRGLDLAEFDPNGVNPWMAEVQSVELRKKDLQSAKIGKKDAAVYSAEKIRIRGRGYLGAQHMEDEYEQVQKGPVPLSVIYKV